KAGDGRRSVKQAVANESAEINHADIFAHNIDRPNTQPTNARNLDAALFQIDRGRTKRRLVQRNAHAPNEIAVKQGGERAGIDHELSGGAVNRAVDIEIVA